MTPAILSAILLLQADPQIEKIERLAGGIRRPLLWSPLAVTVSSAAGFRGDLTARSALGFSVARRVEVAPGGRRRVILPAVDPVEVAAGGTRLSTPPERSGAEILVGVDSRLSCAEELTSTDRVLYRKIEAGDLAELLEGGLLEAFDLLLLAGSEGLPLGAYGTVGTWVAVRTREEAEAAVAALEDPGPRFEAVDVEPQRLWELAPRGGWVPAKKTQALFFSVVYAFAAFVGLAAAARRGARAVMVAEAGVAVLFAGLFFLVFPRGQLWVVEYSCEVVPAEGEAAEWRVWFAGAGAEARTEVIFPRLVKPVFPTSAGAEEPFTVRPEGKGCRVEGLKVPAGKAFCFVAGGGRTPSMRAGEALPAPLYRAAVVREGRVLSAGDLPAGAPVPPEGEGDAPRDPEVAALAARFLSDGCVLGRLDPGERPARDVASPDLADARVRPRIIVMKPK